ncbi:MAG: HIT family protein [Candidatus Micrarchaeia archaeon]
MVEKCVFCDKENIKKAGIIYEDNLCYVLLNKYPISKGHILVISKTHYSDILAAPKEVIYDMFFIAKEVALSIDSIYKPKGIKIITNAKDIVEIAHFHIHVIPIYEDLDYEGFKRRKEISEQERQNLLKDFENFKISKN